MKRLLVFLLIFPIFLHLMIAVDDRFKTVERIKVDVDQPFSSFSSFRKLPDGFVLLLMESRTNYETPILVKIDKNGRFQKKYKEWGEGPGQMKRISGIYVLDDAIYASEGVKPWLHQFDLNLNFVKDIKIKKGGKLIIHNDKYIGIWSTITKGENEFYKLALYGRKDFQFIRNAYRVNEFPPLVFSWGGICRIDANTYAGVYPPDFQIKLFDAEFNYIKDVFQETPGHVAKYTKWNKDPNHLDNEMYKWFQGWTKVNDVFFVKNHFIITYNHQGKGFLDIIDRDGNLKIKQLDAKAYGFSFVEDDYLWRLDWEETEEDREYYLVKVEINI